MRIPFSLTIGALLTFTIFGCNNQDPDQPAAGSISIKARSNAVNERAKSAPSAKKARGEGRS
jgi:hypothetical protein